MKEHLIKSLVKERKEYGLRQLARRIQMSPSTLYRVINFQGGNIGTWDRIAKYYGKK